MSVPPHSPFTSMGTHAQMLGKNCPDAKLAMLFQYVAIGSMVMMGLAGAVHLVKDIGGTWKNEPANRDCRRMREDVDRHEQGRER